MFLTNGEIHEKIFRNDKPMEDVENNAWEIESAY
jgi:hypothetical protein